MANNSKIFSKLSVLAIGTGMLLFMTGCENKVEQEKISAINKYQEYMKNKEDIVLKTLETKKTYKDFIKELTNSTRTTEKEIYELLKTNIIEDKKFRSYSDKSIQERDFTVELFSKKFEFRNKNIEQDKIDKIIKETVKESLMNDISFENMSISVINSVYAITSLNIETDNQNSLDFDNLNIIKIEENFNSKYNSSTNINGINSLDFIDIFDTTKNFKDNSSDKFKVVKEIESQIRDINSDINSLEESITKQIKILEETQRMGFSKEQIEQFVAKAEGLSFEDKSKLILMRDYIKILENYIKIVETMEIKNDLEMSSETQFVPGGGYSHTGGYSSRAHTFIPMFINNHSSDVSNFSSSRSGGYSGLSSSSSRGSYGG